MEASEVAGAGAAGVMLWVPGPLPGMNEIVDAAKSGRGKFNAYSRMKSTWTGLVENLAKRAKLSCVPGPARVHFRWLERDKRRDPDNVTAGAKFVLDGLVKAGVLESDRQEHVHELIHEFSIAHRDDGPGVWVTVDLAPPF